MGPLLQGLSQGCEPVAKAVVLSEGWWGESWVQGHLSGVGRVQLLGFGPRATVPLVQRPPSGPEQVGLPDGTVSQGDTWREKM